MTKENGEVMPCALEAGIGLTHSGLGRSHLVLSVFGFGLIALAAFGASLMIEGK